MDDKPALKFLLTVAFGTSTVWMFNFKSEEAAAAVFDAASAARGDFNKTVKITDDYGQTATIGGGLIGGINLENLDITAEAAIERHLHQMRTNLKAQRAIENDPALKAAAMLGQGMRPGGGNAVFRQ